MEQKFRNLLKLIKKKSNYYKIMMQIFLKIKKIVLIKISLITNLKCKINMIM